VAENVADKLARLSRMTVGELRQQWKATFHESARSFNRQYLHKRLAWQVQADAFGGLSMAAQERLEQLLPLAPLWLPMARGFTPAVPQAGPDDRLKPGSIITRVYRGRTLTVLVRDDSRFEWAGDVYESLTAVAQAITGSHWNGNLFFGLRPARRRA
jgi:hypothetical protein